MQRLAQLKEWLAARFADRQWEIAPASADASFRRYFRVRFADGSPSLVVMDARPRMRIAVLHPCRGGFGAAGAHVPKVLDQDLAQGFLLLSDLGDTTYLQALDPQNAHNLYAEALGALIAIRRRAARRCCPSTRANCCTAS